MCTMETARWKTERRSRANTCLRNPGLAPNCGTTPRRLKGHRVLGMQDDHFIVTLWESCGF